MGIKAEKDQENLGGSFLEALDDSATSRPVKDTPDIHQSIWEKALTKVLDQHLQFRIRNYILEILLL